MSYTHTERERDKEIREDKAPQLTDSFWKYDATSVFNSESLCSQMWTKCAKKKRERGIFTEKHHLFCYKHYSVWLCLLEKS